MKSCLLCPRNKLCRGVILQKVMLNLMEALAAHKGREVEDILRELDRADLETLAGVGANARETCWSKAFVMTMARRLAILAAGEPSEAVLRSKMDRLFVEMDMMFTRLPKGISIDVEDLLTDIYNQAQAVMKAEKQEGFLPMRVFGAAAGGLSVKKRKAKGKG